MFDFLISFLKRMFLLTTIVQGVNDHIFKCTPSAYSWLAFSCVIRKLENSHQQLDLFWLLTNCCLLQLSPICLSPFYTAFSSTTNSFSSFFLVGHLPKSLLLFYTSISSSPNPLPDSASNPFLFFSLFQGAVWGFFL